MRCWKCFKILFLVFFSLLIFLGISVFLFRSRIRDFVVDKTVEFLQKKTGASIVYNKVEGDVITGIRFRNVRVEAGNFKIKVEDFKISYSIFSLFKLPVINLVYINNGIVELIQSSEVPTKKFEIKGIEPGFALLVKNAVFKNIFILYKDTKITVKELKGKVICKKEKASVEIKKISGGVKKGKNKFNVNKIAGKIILNKEGFKFENLFLQTSIIKGEVTAWVFRDSIGFRTKGLYLYPHELYKKVKGKINLRGNWNYSYNLHRGEVYIKGKDMSYLLDEKYTFAIKIKGKGKKVEMGVIEEKKRVRADLKVSIDSGIVNADLFLKSFEVKGHQLYIGNGTIKGYGNIKKSLWRLEGVFKNIGKKDLEIDSICISMEGDKKRFLIHNASVFKNKACINIIGAIGNELSLRCKIKNLTTEDTKGIVNLQFKGVLNADLKIEGKKSKPVVNGEMWVVSDIVDSVKINFDKFSLVEMYGKAYMTVKNFKTVGRKISGKIILAERKLEMMVFLNTGGELKINAQVIPENKTILIKKVRFVPEQNKVFISRSDAIVSFMKKGIKVDNFNIYGESGNVEFSMVLNPERVIEEFRMFVDGLDLSILGNFLEKKIKGYLYVKTHVKEFKGDVNLCVKDFSYSEIAFKNFELSSQLSKKKKVINIQMDGKLFAEDISIVKGRAKVDMKNKKIVEFDIFTELNNPGVWVFSFLKRVVELKKGNIIGEFRVWGKPEVFDVTGSIKINDGEIYLPSFNLEGTNAVINISLRNRRIYVLNSMADVDGGKLYGNGIFNLASKNGNYEFDFSFDDLPLSLNGIYVVTGGYLNLKGNLKGDLIVRGEMNIDEGLLFYEIGKSDETSTKSMNLPDISISVKGEKGIWLRNKMMDVELSPDIIVRGKKDKLMVAGEIKILRGNVYYLEHIFRIERGEIKFTSQEEMNPEIDILAKTVTDRVVEHNGKKTRIKIYLHLYGDLKKLLMDFYSEPTVMSEDDILTYLAFNITSEDIYSKEERELLTQALSGIAVKFARQQIEKRLKEVFPVDYFTIESTEQGTKFTLGKYITPRLYVSYTGSLGSTEDAYKIEFETKKNQQIVIEKTEENRYSVRYEIFWEF